MAIVKIINHSKRRTSEPYKKRGDVGNPKYKTYHVFAEVPKEKTFAIQDNLREAYKNYSDVRIRDVYIKRTNRTKTQILGRKLRVKLV